MHLTRLPPHTFILPITLRIILFLSGISYHLQSRIELASSSSGLPQLKDAAFLYSTNNIKALSSIASFKGPLLAVPLAVWTNGSLPLHIGFNIVCDVLSAIVLASLVGILKKVSTIDDSSKIKKHKEDSTASISLAAASAFLYSPITVATCASGSLGSFRVLLILLAAFIALRGSSSGGKKNKSVKAVAAAKYALVVKAAVLIGGLLAVVVHLGGGGRAAFHSSWNDALLMVPLLLALNSKQQQNNVKTAHSLLLPVLTTCAAILSFLAATLCLLTFTNIFVLHQPPLLVVKQLFASFLFVVLPSHNNDNTLHYSNSSFSPLLPWNDVSPNLGLQWYLFAEVFPRFRILFLYVVTFLPLMVMLPVAVRFYKQPVVVLCCQAVVNCMVGQWPTYSDISIWMCFLMLLPSNIITNFNYAIPITITLFSALAASTASFELWLSLGTGNANFFYGMNLTWAGAQILLVSQLIKAAARVEVGWEKEKEEKELGDAKKNE